MTPQSEAGWGLPRPPRPRPSPERSDPGGTWETPLRGLRGPGGLSLPPRVARPRRPAGPPPRAAGTSGARTSSREDQEARRAGARRAGARRAFPRPHSRPQVRRGPTCVRAPAGLVRFPGNSLLGGQWAGIGLGVRPQRLRGKGTQTLGSDRLESPLTASKRVVNSPSCSVEAPGEIYFLNPSPAQAAPQIN